MRVRISAPPERLFFFFNDTATTEIYTLSLHDALPIYRSRETWGVYWSPSSSPGEPECPGRVIPRSLRPDRKSTRLNSSHGYISYAVFCLNKKSARRQQRHCQFGVHVFDDMELQPLRVA